MGPVNDKNPGHKGNSGAICEIFGGKPNN